ncbi:MAG: hypothetical protein J5I93_28855 [Pirellulaceae bacterium]|nr:hypothetical protein [Pirellulaceae bacterium]
MLTGSSTVSGLAYELLQQQVDAVGQDFFAYRDADSALNHGTPSGIFPAEDRELIRLDATCVSSTTSATGCSEDPLAVDRQRGTVMQVEFLPLGAGQFAGLAIEEPAGFLDHGQGNGYDLTGATHLVFEARSPTPGGVRVQFAVAGRTTAFQQVPRSDGFVEFSLSLDELQVSAAELADLQWLFSIATNDVHASGGGIVLLDNIRFEPTPADPFRTLDLPRERLGLPLGNETFGAVPATDTPFGPDQVLANLATTYEASLTVLSLLERGTQADVARARLIADSLLYALRNDQAEPSGLPTAVNPQTLEVVRGLHDGYFAHDLPLINDQPSGPTSGQVKLAGFGVNSTRCDPNPEPNETYSFCLLQDGATAGNNAFAVLAFLAVYRQSGNAEYLDAAREISHWIVEMLRDNSNSGYGGYYFGFNEGGEVPRVLRTAKSIENNADIYAAFSQLAAIERALGNAGDADTWQQHAIHAGDFVMAMYDPGDPVRNDDGHFYAGTVPLGTSPGPGVIPSGDLSQTRGTDVINLAEFLDSNTFTTLALARSLRYRSQIDWREPIRYLLERFAVQDGQGVTANGATFEGFSIVHSPEPDASRLGSPSPSGIAWEFTAQAVVAMQFVDALYGTSEFRQAAAHYLREIERAQTLAPFADGRGMVAATLDGEDETNTPFPARDHCLTTPFQCIPERVGMAATNWAIYAAEGLNILAPQLPLPLSSGQEFVVDNWNNEVTRNDLGFNDFAGNTGTTETVAGTTRLELSRQSRGDTGGSLELSFDFTGQGSEVFAGYFASLFGLTDTLISLDGDPAEPADTTRLPGYFLDTQDVYRGSLPLAGRSLEQLAFDYQRISPEPITLKVELRDEAGWDVFTRRPLAGPAASWRTIVLDIPADFQDSISGGGDPSAFNWRELSTLSVIIERNNVGAGIANPTSGQFLLDNLRLLDNDGQYPDLERIADPTAHAPHHLYEEGFLDLVRASSLRYFVDWSSTDPRTGGLVQDRSTFADLMTAGGAGFQLTGLAVAAERGYLARSDAAQRTRNILRMLHDQPQGPAAVGTAGNQGFFYHFLGIDGLRKQNFDFSETTDLDESLNTVELSTIDTALAVAGAVTAGRYFAASSPLEQEIRELAEAIYARVNWKFMLDDERFTNSRQFFLGWKPNETRDDDSGRYGRFKLDDSPDQPTGQYSSRPDGNVELPATLDYYTDEGLLIALLAMGSPNPDHRVGRDVWDAMIRDEGGGTFVRTYPGALFTYEFASVWLDTEVLGTDNHQPFGGRAARPTNFFHNSREAILATREHTSSNPDERASWEAGGGATRWGLSAAEGPFDGYSAHAAPTAAIAIDAGFVTAAAGYAVQAEAGSGDGTIMPRGNAAGGQTVHLGADQTRTIVAAVPVRTEYTLQVRYSNDNFGPTETLEVFVDGQSIGTFSAEDTGNFGAGWNVFADSPALGPVALDPGEHTISLLVTGGDGYGVEVDQVTLRHADLLRPLEDGTTTVYGAGSAIKHVPDLAVAALWEAISLGLFHPRFGFADAFNLNINDAVISEQTGGEILRTDGAWANLTGFSIDHGPMAIMIDNYLQDDFAPRLFMSHPQIASSLATLFPGRQVFTLSLAGGRIAEDGGGLTATITRWNSDNTDELTVRLTATNAAGVLVPATVSILADQMSAEFPVEVMDDILIEGTQSVVIVAQANGFEPVSELLEVDDQETWRNPFNRYDVIADGTIAPNDVLAIINTINAFGARPLPLPLVPPAMRPAFYDVTGDGNVAPNDVLAVINYVNANPGAAGEAPVVAEPAAAPVIAPPSRLGAVDPLADSRQPRNAMATATRVRGVTYAASAELPPRAAGSWLGLNLGSGGTQPSVAEPRRKAESELEQTPSTLELSVQGRPDGKVALVSGETAG